MLNRKSQTSFEYLYLIGFLLVVLTPLIYYSFNTSTSQVRLERLAESLDSLKHSVDVVFSLGPKNVQIATIYLPGGIHNITISGKEITIKAYVSGMLSDYHFSAPINVTGSIDNEQGIHNLRIEYLTTGMINITEP